ncbi:hypothetical protein Mapa_014994 [Marchantia paleacea]|nr:hypothetical protein Mapa_014994 [Marchantia paleacea]
MSSYLANVHESSRTKSCHCCNSTGVGKSLGEDKRGHISPTSLPKTQFERGKPKISSIDRYPPLSSDLQLEFNKQ